MRSVQLKLGQRVASCLCRHYSASSLSPPRVAIVGGGPGGFYTAQHILKGHPTALVDVYEQLPVPFGLVRFGVAPDHPEVKNVINTFTQTANHDRCTYIGNVTIGKDVRVQDLRQAYTAVVLAYGADQDKSFGIPGEDLKGVLSARSFVGWYNGLPQNSNLQPDLSSTDTAVILGVGNVALDIARILITPLDIIRKTDITEYAVEALSKSRIKQVYMVGRRGPLQVAFTTAELREMIKLPGCRPALDKDDFQHIAQHIKEIPRPRKRLTELMIKVAMETPGAEDAERWASAPKQWRLKFLRSPMEFLPSQDQQTLAGVKFAVNRLEGPMGVNQKAVATEETEDLPCGLVLRSIGYRSTRADPDIPFDDKQGIIPNTSGRVLGETGLYCSGWVKKGPIGVIATTMNEAFETAKIVLQDLQSLPLSSAQQGSAAILDILKTKGIETVNFEEWEKINTAEIQQGETCGKPREKIVTVEEMMRTAKQN